ncbi:hypothetical protein D3C76_1024580 [compost metagenome]
MTVWVIRCSGMSSTLAARFSISSMKAARAPEARPGRALLAIIRRIASHMATSLTRANSRMFSTVFSPMPRGGTLITRSSAASLPRPSSRRR